MLRSKPESGWITSLIHCHRRFRHHPPLQRIVDFTATHRLPAISISGGSRRPAGSCLRAEWAGVLQAPARLFDKILKGAKACRSPHRAADQIRLRLNLKTAKALGLTIPQSLLLKADQVIE